MKIGIFCTPNSKTKYKLPTGEEMFIIDKELLFRIWKGLLWYKEENEPFYIKIGKIYSKRDAQ